MTASEILMTEAIIAPLWHIYWTLLMFEKACMPPAHSIIVQVGMLGPRIVCST